MTGQRRYSSDEVFNGLIRAGFEVPRTAQGQRRRAKGSHQVLRRPRPDGGHDTVVLVLGRKQLQPSTLALILKQAHMTEDELAQLIE